MLRNFPIDLEGFAALTPDWRFTIAVSDHGLGRRHDQHQLQRRRSRSAALQVGTLRVDLLVNTSAGPVNCSSGDVSWTASPPA